MLIAPEGDSRRMRHAHTDCVLSARRRGELPLRDEWLRAQRAGRPRRRLWLGRLRRGS